MLLICPSCSTKYNVADSAIPAKGRTVRCAACGHSWTQLPDPALQPAGAEDAVPAPAGPPPGQPERRARPRPAAHTAVRAKAHNRIRAGQLAAAVVPWAVAAAVLGTLGLTAVSHRTDIVRAWPKSAGAFALIGQPANLYGIDIAQVQARAGIDTKGPRVIVGGVVRSVSRKPEPVPWLQVALVDSKGVEKTRWLVDPGVTVLQPGAFHAFETARSNPPRGSVKAVVTFGEPPPKAPRAPPPPPEPPTGKTGLMGAKGDTGGKASEQPGATQPSLRGSQDLPAVAAGR